MPSRAGLLTVQSTLGLHGGRLVAVAGDGFLAVFDEPSHPCGRQSCRSSRGPAAADAIDTGEIEWRGDDLDGIAVHVGASIAALAAEAGILVSRTVRELVSGSGTPLVSRGQHVLKGVDGGREIYPVDARGAVVRSLVRWRRGIRTNTAEAVLLKPRRRSLRTGSQQWTR